MRISGPGHVSPEHLPLPWTRRGTERRHADQAGDLVGELHLSNRDTLRHQLKYNSRVKAAIAARKGLTQDLVLLAERVAAGQDLAEVKAFFAITMLYHGARVLGFEDQEFTGNRVLRWLYTLGEGFLLALYHPAGIRRFWQGRQDLTTKYIWMSRQKLLHDFLPSDETVASGSPNTYPTDRVGNISVGIHRLVRLIISIEFST